ncbi:cyclase family protein [Patescibacteria group bacterium]|nr:cyclase family protein [Patescibacteria group bacterium]
MKIFDISLTIDSNTIVYPGNPEVEITPHHTIPQHSSNLSKIVFGSHTGTHVDAPKHADNRGAGVDNVDLYACFGPCRVLDMTQVKDAIRIEDLSAHKIQRCERILVKTRNSFRGFERFYEDFVYLDGDAACWLAEKEIVLFGIDYLSVKKRGSKDNRAHTCLLSKRIIIFEGLDLSRVDPGEYTFVGLPLKFKGLDGSPARAILIQDLRYKI